MKEEQELGEEAAVEREAAEVDLMDGTPYRARDLARLIADASRGLEPAEAREAQLEPAIARLSDCLWSLSETLLASLDAEELARVLFERRLAERPRGEWDNALGGSLSGYGDVVGPEEARERKARAISLARLSRWSRIALDGEERGLL